MWKLTVGTVGVMGFALAALLITTAVVLASLVIVAPAYSIEIWRRLKPAVGGVAQQHPTQSGLDIATHGPSWLPEPSNDR